MNRAGFRMRMVVGLSLKLKVNLAVYGKSQLQPQSNPTLVTKSLPAWLHDDE
jgi:hypothetical protein